MEQTGILAWRAEVHHFPEKNASRVGLVPGDVSGHMLLNCLVFVTVFPCQNCWTTARGLVSFLDAACCVLRAACCVCVASGRERPVELALPCRQRVRWLGMLAGMRKAMKRHLGKAGSLGLRGFGRECWLAAENEESILSGGRYSHSVGFARPVNLAGWESIGRGVSDFSGISD